MGIDCGSVVGEQWGKSRTTVIEQQFFLKARTVLNILIKILVVQITCPPFQGLIVIITILI